MKIAVLADIHSNYIALEAIYKYLRQEKVDYVLFLGDLVTDCPYPNKVFKIFKKFNKYFKTKYIKGNREEYLFNLDLSNKVLTSLNGSIYYTKKKIKRKNYQFLLSLDNHGTLDIDGYPPIFYSHGTPTNNRELLTIKNIEETHKYLENNPCDYILCGHSHKQFIYHHLNKTLVNPGPVGVHDFGVRKACFAILNGINSKWEINLQTLDYNIEKLLKDFKRSKILKYGKTYTRGIIDSFNSGTSISSELIALGFKLAGENEITEEHFVRAYQEIKGK